MRVALEIKDPKKLALILLCAVAFALAFVRCFVGYGYDDDTYRMLNSFQSMVSLGRYEPSRYQGYIVAEFMLGFTAWLGSSILSNLTVLAASLVSLIFTWKSARFLGVRNPLLVVALCATNGYFLIASATSMDYIIAYCFFSVGLYFYLSDNWLPACIFLAIAAGARLPYFAISLVAIFGWQIANRKYRASDFWRTAQFGLFLFFVSGLFYLPIWISHSLHFDWLNDGTVNTQGVFGYVARFVYKTLNLFGLVGSIIAFGLLLYRLSRKGRDGANHRAVIFSAFVIGINLLIFIFVPVDTGYLIPVIPFVGTLLAGLGMEQVVWVLILGNILANCVNVTLLDVKYHDVAPCARDTASGAIIRPHLEAGLLVKEFRDLDQQDVCYRNHLLRFPYRDIWDRLRVAPRDRSDLDML